MTATNSPSDKGAPSTAPADQRVHIIPREAIGPLRLGAKESELPSAIRATIDRGFGTYDSIEFALENGVVREVRIDNVLSFPGELILDGHSVSREPNEQALERFFGPCHPGPGSRGGRQVVCDSGLRLSFNHHPADETDEREVLSSVQVRVGPKS